MKLVKKNPKTPPSGAPSGSLPPQPQRKHAGHSSPVFNIPVTFLKVSPEQQMQISRMVRSGSCETPRPQAGGKGIGCPARMFRSILPAPPRRHVSSRASEDGILAAQPRGGFPGQSWDPSRRRRSADSGSALVLAPVRPTPLNTARPKPTPSPRSGGRLPLFRFWRCCLDAAGWFSAM